MSAERGPHPGEPDDVDLEFKRIVAGLELDPPQVEEPPPDSGDGDTDDPDRLPSSTDTLFDPRFSDRMTRQDYEDAREADDPGDHFEPPDPPAQRIRPLTLLGWIGAVGTPAFMALVAVFGWYIPGEIAAALVAAFVAGVVYLIMTTSRDPDDGDDGAIV